MKRHLSVCGPPRMLPVLCLSLLLMAASALADQGHRYREQTGGEVFDSIWRAEQTRSGVLITLSQRDGREVFTSVNDPDGATRSWRYLHPPATDVRAERVGDSLRFSGRLKGKPVRREERIDSRPWYQPLTFSLARMAARNQRHAGFWTVRPDTLDVLAMQAELETAAPVPAEGAPAGAIQVSIRLDGLLSGLWRADYWFRASDHLFVRYRGVHGPPGAPETTITLVEP